jgi:hypothetical protein
VSQALPDTHLLHWPGKSSLIKSADLGCSKSQAVASTAAAAATAAAFEALSVTGLVSIGDDSTLQLTTSVSFTI